VNEQELNKKLAEWVGLKENHWTKKWFDSPSHSIGDLPNFAQSLDACFKWLVPKVGIYSLWRGRPRIMGIPEEVPVSEHNAEAWNDMNYGYAHSKESLALALCLAIEKLIDEGS